jgi:hypothetical protein
MSNRFRPVTIVLSVVIALVATVATAGPEVTQTPGSDSPMLMAFTAVFVALCVGLLAYTARRMATEP